MKLKGIVTEDFVNYSKPSLFLITSVCDWKCCKEANIPISVCQNQSLVNQPEKDFSCEDIYQVYINNDITKAIVIGGLEPILQFQEVFDLIYHFRQNGCINPFVIYTGYYPDEIEDELQMLKMFENIIVKFGRYMPDNQPHFDKVLGVNLISDNQYAIKIS